MTADDNERSRRTVLRSAGLLATGLAVGAGEVSAGQRTCGPAASSPPPGPPVLYDGPASAPQFENGQGWRADPLLVSGASAHVDGEFLYQDWVYDDHGANTTDLAAPPEQEPGNNTYGAMTGDVVYPTDDERYAHNAADLLEFRARREGATVVYRVTFNTMEAPDAAAFAVGVDRREGTATDDWGYGLGALGAPVDDVLVAWGTGAELNGAAVDVSVDEERNQVEVRAPLDPGTGTWRHYLVTGLWDADAGAFKQIRERPTADEPGGAHGRSPPPVFNVGFRRNEQESMGSANADVGTLEQQAEEGAESGSRGEGFGHWRDHEQALALGERDISAFHADVDFGLLAARETAYDVPETGFVDRLYASRHRIGDRGGVDPDGDLLRGRVQPYSVYVPESYEPGTSAPLHVHLHSLTATYNQYAVFSPNVLRQLGERRDAIVLTPEARGPGEWYHDAGELGVFEAWADLRARYDVDPDRVTLGGYSMGGFGTYKLASQYPDLFARGFAVVGPPDESIFGGPTGGAAGTEHNAMRITDNLRHVPLLMWAGTNDELVPFAGVTRYEEQLRQHGYRHELDAFPGYDHFLFSVRDEWGPGREFLGDATVERDPSRVTYRAVPAMDNDEFGLVHDGAYWVSDVVVADEEGLVDAESLARPTGDPVAVDFHEPGTEPSPHAKRGTRWRDPLTTPPAENAVEATLEGVESATLWVEEAGAEPTRPLRLRVTSDGPATVTLAGSFGTRDVSVSAGTTERTLELC